MKSTTKASSQMSYLSNLDQGGKIIAEYIWIDGAQFMRSKSRTLNIPKVNCLADLPEWNYDGSSCYHATTENSEIIMKPVAYYPDPFRGGNNVIVLTETFCWEDTTYQKLIPTNSNFRHFAKPIWDSFADEKTWYGIEQEYTFLEEKSRFHTKPYGWPENGYPSNQGPYYCSVGGNVNFGRTIADAHYKCCLYAGINISGTNAEVMPGQWEFQIGPCEGIEIGDHLWVARYLLARCAEDYNMSISFEPKLFTDWNGSGCHCNFSTAKMREGSGGMKYIEDMMENFKAKHQLHMQLYGEDNNQRLTGIHETSSFTDFSYGTGDRGASFRIPTATAHANGKGYIEDRRPASNIDPYLVGSIMVDTACGKKTKAEAMLNHFQAWSKWLSQTHIEKA